jgi:hypothetical protein
MFNYLGVEMSFSIRQLYLSGYRAVGFTVLAGSLIAFLGSGLLMAFFMFNYTWIAPTILSPTSDKMLQFQSGYLNEQQAVSTLKVTLESQKRMLATTKGQLASLISFRNKIKDGTELQQSKVKDIHNSGNLNSKLTEQRNQIQNSLDSGLITKTDAIMSQVWIQNFNNSTTDSRVSLANLDQQLINLDVQIATTSDLVATEEQTVSETEKNLAIATSALSTLNSTAYAAAMNKGSNLAFLPYDNIKAGVVGAPVYDCRLMIVWCRQVGTIAKIYTDEQLVDFPLFNVRLSRTSRGVLISLDMTDPTAMKSQIVFAGSKPLLF